MALGVSLSSSSYPLILITVITFHSSLSLLAPPHGNGQKIRRGNIVQPKSLPPIERRNVFSRHRPSSSLTRPTELFASSSSSYLNSNINADGKCKFGTKAYWDDMYDGNADRPSESYSWYCGYNEFAPFWDMLVNPESTNDHKTRTKVLVAGIGNDSSPVDLYDHGWTNMIAFDYSEAGVHRAKELFASRDHVQLLTADCRDLPLPDGLVNATLDKGTLDAIYITGKEVLEDSVKELTRVTAENGVILCISAVIPSEELMEAFSSSGMWDVVHHGGLAFAPDGEATIDLGANLFSWRKRPSQP